jgi:UDP-glucose 4-epimerase
MTILVTGGAGYIGSHMAHALVERGEKVVVLDNLATGVEWIVPHAATFVRGDIADKALVSALIRDNGIVEIIHFAGSVVVPDSVADPLAYYLNNTAKSRDLLEAAVTGGVERFIFSSTAAVYGQPDQVPVLEDAELQPMSPYGRSKLMTEWMLRDTAAATGLTYAALRYFNVAGADPKGRTGQSTPRATHLIKVACETAVGARPHLDIFGRDYPTADGTCVRDYIHVSDLIAAHDAALAHLRGGGDSSIYNCGYGRGYSVLEVIAAVERATGRPLPVRDAPRRPGDPPAIVAGAQRARTVLGWAPRHDDLDFIVASALEWERRLRRRNAEA